MAVVFESLNKKSMIQSFLKKHWSVIAWFLVALTFLSVVAYVLNFNLNHKPYEKYVLSDEAADWGTFGDYIGGFVGTIFTMIAALFVWLTYDSQREQLVLAKETAVKERFETTFFHMVSELKDIIQSIEGFVPKKEPDDLCFICTDTIESVTIPHIGNGTRIFLEKGNSFFSKVCEGLIIYYTKVSQIPEIGSEDYERKLYNIYYGIFLTELDHYFRFFYNILKFIDRSEIQDKKLYADLLQAQLSKHELALIFYNGIGEIGKLKLFPLLEKYNFLENLNQNTIYEGHHKFYPQTTFRFLPEPEKYKIIVEAILDDPDKVADKEKTDYYLRKYNRDSKDEITKLTLPY